jgi:hypothetical protein
MAEKQRDHIVPGSYPSERGGDQGIGEDLVPSDGRSIGEREAGKRDPPGEAEKKVAADKRHEVFDERYQRLHRRSFKKPTSSSLWRTRVSSSWRVRFTLFHVTRTVRWTCVRIGLRGEQGFISLPLPWSRTLDGSLANRCAFRDDS